MQTSNANPSLVIVPVDNDSVQAQFGQRVFDLFVIEPCFDEVARILALLQDSYCDNIAVSDAVGAYDDAHGLVGVRLYLHDFSVMRLLFWLGYHWEDALIPMP